MDKQQKLKIVLPALLVVMTFVWGPIFFGSGSKSKTGNNSVSVNNNSLNSSSGLQLSGLSYSRTPKKARTSFSEWGQNPFMLKRAPKAIYIEGIMWEANNPKAIINGNIVGAGDVVEDKTIIEVRPNSVIIKGKDGKEVELK